MNIRELLGEDFKEGMTVEEIETIFSNKDVKLANLSTGDHVGKGKHMRELQDAEAKFRREIAERETRISELTGAETTLSTTNQELMNKVNALVLENNKSKYKSSLMGLGYDDTIIDEMVDMEFYEGDDKVVKKSDLMRRATANLLANKEKERIDKEPNVGGGADINGEVGKLNYQKQLNDLRASGDMVGAISLISKAASEGISLS